MDYPHNKSFEDRADAENFLLEKAKEEARAFCPLISSTCRDRCVCFNKGDLAEDADNKRWYIISTPGCRNAMFFGDYEPDA